MHLCHTNYRKDCGNIVTVSGRTTVTAILFPFPLFFIFW